MYSIIFAASVFQSCRGVHLAPEEVPHCLLTSLCLKIVCQIVAMSAVSERVDTNYYLSSYLATTDFCLFTLLKEQNTHAVHNFQLTMTSLSLWRTLRGQDELFYENGSGIQKRSSCGNAGIVVLKFVEIML